MSDGLVRCFACGAAVPAIEGPTHRYMASSPGCWAIYGGILALEYSNALYAKNHRLTVDAYAVQHPGEPSRQAIRSVCMHLCTLCAVYECGLTSRDATALLQSLAERTDYQWLEPPPSSGDVTVADVQAAPGPREHLEKVDEWARSAWAAWRLHHGTVRKWVEAAL